MLKTTSRTFHTVYYVNARSGRGEGLQMLARGDLGTMVEIDPRDMQAQIRQHAEHHDRIVVAGGDGTFSLFIDTVFRMGLQDEVCLYLVPLGTGNDLARSLGVLTGFTALPTSAEDWDREFERTTIPIWRYGEKYFVNYISCGMDAKMLAMVEDYRNRFPNSLLLRKASLTVASLRHLTYLVQTSSAIELDGEIHPIKGKAGLIISNMPYYLGGSRLSSLDPHDACLSVTFIDTGADLIRLGLSRNLPLLPDPVLPFHRAERIRLIGPALPMQIDGEVGQYEEAAIEYAGRIGIWLPRRQ